jgi:hypothetical protein
MTFRSRCDWRVTVGNDRICVEDRRSLCDVVEGAFLNARSNVATTSSNTFRFAHRDRQASDARVEVDCRPILVRYFVNNVETFPKVDALERDDTIVRRNIREASKTRRHSSARGTSNTYDELLFIFVQSMQIVSVIEGGHL